MVGMLQIITYLLCIYLVFKGVEIYQIAAMSTKERKGGGIALGIIAIVLSIIIAIGFAAWADTQAQSISDAMPQF